MPDDFKEIASRIERNPLGRLMYGQRELFHSNLPASSFPTSSTLFWCRSPKRSTKGWP